LPIAVGILCAFGALKNDDLSRVLMVGELGLDGSERAVPGMLPVANLAREKKIPNLILPAGNAAEAAVVEGVERVPGGFAARCAGSAERRGQGRHAARAVPCVDREALGEPQQFTVDFSSR
jgi:magnesium chelatase family protein